MIPGEIICQKGNLELNKGRPKVKLMVENRGDRPVQVGSHFHFFEVNRGLYFDRQKSFGTRLNIPSGTAVRFEPGDDKEVELIDFGGRKKSFGFNGLTEGKNLSQAVAKAKKKGFVENTPSSHRIPPP